MSSPLGAVYTLIGLFRSPGPPLTIPSIVGQIQGKPCRIFSIAQNPDAMDQAQTHLLIRVSGPSSSIKKIQGNTDNDRILLALD